MAMNARTRRRLALQSGAFVALLLAAAVLLGYLAWKGRVQWDITQNARNSLAPESRALLQQIEGPVTVTVYATPQDPQPGDLRKRLRDFLGRYQNVKPDFHVSFVDPEADPAAARTAGIQVNGEMVVQYRGRSERFSPFQVNEHSFASLLQRLARRTQVLVAALDGHGERRLDGVANHDLGQFGRELESKGFKLLNLNLAVAQQVPANAALLLIASPQVELLPGEMGKILAYVERGGNLLWLLDPEPLRGLDTLAEKLGLQFSSGVVVDPEARRMGAPVTWALANAYGSHPVTRNFSLNTVFPMARQLATGEESGWRATPVVEAAPGGWVESGILDDKVAFDPQRDIRGPIVVALALERNRNEREQRVMVVGSGSFIANAFLGNAANLDLALNMMNWLAGEEGLVSIQPRAVRDGRLELSRPWITAISIGCLVALPLAFFAAAALIGWRRRRL